MLLAVPAMTIAGESANYSLLPQAVDAAGLTGNSASYRGTFSTAPGAAGAGGVCRLRSGYAGQLDLTAIHLTVSPSMVNESSTTQLTASYVTDAGAVTAIAPNDVTWAILSGPLAAITPSGAVTALTVWEDTSAAVLATWSGTTGALAFTVRDTVPDNFAPYAGDHLPDAWEVQHFGLNGILAGPHDDHDGDGVENIEELAFGTDPAGTFAFPDSLSYFGSLTGGGTLLRPGLPVMGEVTTGAEPGWGAVFVRRADFEDIGLRYTPQFSVDLATWADAEDEPAVLAEDGVLETLLVRPPADLSGKTRHYFRVLTEVEP